MFPPYNAECYRRWLERRQRAIDDNIAYTQMHIDSIIDYIWGKLSPENKAALQADGSALERHQSQSKASQMSLSWVLTRRTTDEIENQGPPRTGGSPPETEARA